MTVFEEIFACKIAQWTDSFTPRKRGRLEECHKQKKHNKICIFKFENLYK